LLDELETWEHPDDPGKSIIDLEGHQLIERVGVILGDEFVGEFDELHNIMDRVCGARTKCDGNHGGPRCADPECWNDDEKEQTIPHGLDTPERVCFYEQEFYVLSNFSAFAVRWHGETFFTSEHAYHWARFDLPDGRGKLLQDCVWRSASAHDAFKFAQENKHLQCEDWDATKVDVMREILCTKIEQHEYVKRKLLQTGDRELVENSWRDDFWGWGPNQDGQNMLGMLWMQIRAELRRQESTGGGER
jgi:hypothetical protein